MRQKLEAQGWWCVRAAGSHGVADLVAIKKSPVDRNPIVLLVSCKVAEYAPPSERAELVRVAEEIGALPRMTVKQDGRWELTAVQP